MTAYADPLRKLTRLYAGAYAVTLCSAPAYAGAYAKLTRLYAGAYAVGSCRLYRPPPSTFVEAAPPPIPLHPRHRSRGAASALFYDIERHISSMAYYIWHSIHYVRRMMCHNWFSTPEQGNVYSKPKKSVGLESWALLWGSHAYAGAYANLTRPYAHAAKIGSCHAYAEAYAKLTRLYAAAYAQLIIIFDSLRRPPLKAYATLRRSLRG